MNDLKEKSRRRRRMARSMRRMLAEIYGKMMWTVGI